MLRHLVFVLLMVVAHHALASGSIDSGRVKEPARCQELRAQLESWEKRARSGTSGKVEIRKQLDESTQYREKRQQTEYINEQIRDLKKESFDLGCAAWGG